MAIGSRRICGHAGCRRLADNDAIRCSRHSDDPTHGWRDWSKYKSSARGYDRQWRNRRLVVLQRDKYLCQPCRRADRVRPAQEVDHVIPRSAGGTDDLDNLQAICRECHAAKTARERIKNEH